MNLKNLFSIADPLKQIKGIEGRLRRRRRNGLLATTGTILFGIVEVARELSVKHEFFLDYLTRVVEYTLYALGIVGHNVWYLVTLRWDEFKSAALVYDVLSFHIIILGIAIYFFSRHTAFLFRMTEKPFQYSFWIERFSRAEDMGANSDGLKQDDPIHHYLHHDLMEMLNRRIGRFSLLDEKYFHTGTGEGKPPPSHIHIDGHYTIRTKTDDDRIVTVIEVMPRVRIGLPGNPSILTQPVEVELFEGNGETEAGKNQSPIDESTYTLVLEQVHSKVASEIYKQIKVDIKQKIHLFPTKYLRARALYYEAEDFSRSNTIDAYDYAIDLYQEALREYDISIRSIFSTWLLRLMPVRLGIEYEAMWDKTKIGYAKCLIYRRVISSLTGRTRNALYEIPIDIGRVVDRLVWLHNKYHLLKWKILPPGRQDIADHAKGRLKNRLRFTLSALTFKKDTWFQKYLCRKLDIAKFETLTKMLFDANVVLALAFANMDSPTEASRHLENAKAVWPQKCDLNALFLLTKAEVELDLFKKIPLLV